jgi:O-antigen/teichoic acid export membrane protein
MLIRHSLLYVLAKFLSGALAMATTAILTRILNPVQYGDFGLTLVTMTFVSAMGFDWLGVSFLRFFADPSDGARTIATVIYLFLALLAASAVLALLVWAVGAFDRKYTEMYALGIGLGWLFSWFELASKIQVGHLRPVQYLNQNLLRAVTMLVGSVGAAEYTHSPIGAAAGMGAGLLVAAPFVSKGIPVLGLRFFSRDLARQILTFGIPLAISFIMGGIIITGTRMLVAALDSVAALGLYTAAFLLVQNSLTVMASGISTAGFQLAVRAVSGGNREQERQQLLDSGALLLAVLAPACLGVGLTAHGLSHLLVGAQFEPVVASLMPWMAAAAFFMSFRSYFLDYAFQLGFRPDLQAGVSAISVVICIALNVYLIPRMGPLGAGIAVTVTMGISCCLATVVGRRAYDIPLPVDAAMRVLLCCAFMTALILLTPARGTAGLMMQIAIGIIGYTGAALALNVLNLRTRGLSFISQRL